MVSPLARGNHRKVRARIGVLCSPTPYVGSGAPYNTLFGKIAPPVSLAGCYSPGTRSATGNGCSRPKTVRRTMITGRDLSNDGAEMLPIIYPNKDEWPGLASRLMAKAQPMMRSQDSDEQVVGFFLFGMAERASGARTMTRGRDAPCCN